MASDLCPACGQALPEPQPPYTGCCDPATRKCKAGADCYARTLVAHMREKKADDPYWIAIADQWEARLRDTEASVTHRDL